MFNRPPSAQCFRLIANLLLIWYRILAGCLDCISQRGFFLYVCTMSWTLPHKRFTSNPMYTFGARVGIYVTTYLRVRQRVVSFPPSSLHLHIPGPPPEPSDENCQPFLCRHIVRHRAACLVRVHIYSSSNCVCVGVIKYIAQLTIYLTSLHIDCHPV